MTTLHDGSLGRPEVSHEASFEYKGRYVTRFDCVTCGNCALVNSNVIGQPEMVDELTDAGICRAAATTALEYTRR